MNRFLKELLSIIAFFILVGFIVVQFTKEAKGEGLEVWIDSGLLCDTKEQVIETLATINKQIDKSVMPSIEGCGMLAKPVYVHIVILGQYEDSDVVVLLARYEFITMRGVVQFGYVRFYNKDKKEQTL